MNQSSHAARDDKWSTSAALVVWKHGEVDSPPLPPQKKHDPQTQTLNCPKDFNKNHAFCGTEKSSHVSHVGLCWRDAVGSFFFPPFWNQPKYSQKDTNSKMLDCGIFRPLNERNHTAIQWFSGFRYTLTSCTSYPISRVSPQQHPQK